MTTAIFPDTDVVIRTGTPSFAPRIVTQAAPREQADYLTLVATTVETRHFERWEANLDRMERLQEGWDGYRAPAPSKHAITLARSFLSTIKAFNPPPSRVAPSAVGGVGITFRNAGRETYVEFFNNGKIYALFSDQRYDPTNEPVKPYPNAFKGLMNKIREFLDA